METSIIVISLVAVMFAMLYGWNLEKKDRQVAEKELYYLKRKHFYFKERIKAIEFYSRKYFDGYVTLKKTLDDIHQELMRHGDGDSDWKDEYQHIEKLLKKASKKASI
jgi:hypothetical protein